MNTQSNTIEPIDEESQLLIDQLYQSISTTMILPDGHTTEVHENGNIALLAYGYRGIISWRKKREEIFGERIYSPYLEILKQNFKQKEVKEKEEKNGK